MTLVDSLRCDCWKNRWHWPLILFIYACWFRIIYLEFPAYGTSPWIDDIYCFHLRSIYDVILSILSAINRSSPSGDFSCGIFDYLRQNIAVGLTFIFLLGFCAHAIQLDIVVKVLTVEGQYAHYVRSPNW